MVEFKKNTDNLRSSETLAELSKSFFKPRHEQDYSLSFLLEQARINSLSQVEYERSRGPSLELDLSNCRIKGRPLIEDFGVSQFFRFALKDFFTGELQKVEVSAGKEHLGRRTDLNFDLRLIGIGSRGDIFESAVFLFDCEAQERSMGTILSGDAPEYRQKYLPTRNIPQSALRTLSQFPREHYKDSKAGTIIALREKPLAFTISPYWSAEAFDIAMQHLVQVGRDLIDEQAIPKAELGGRGILNLKRASVLANSIYQAVNEYAGNNFPEEILNGVSAVEVFKSSNKQFSCRIAVVSLICDEQFMPSELGIGNFQTQKKAHRVFDLDLKRDSYGFLQLKVVRSELIPFFQLKWTDNLRDIIEEDPLEGLD